MADADGRIRGLLGLAWRLVPRTWRETVAADLANERAGAGRPPSAWWSAAQAARIGLRFRGNAVRERTRRVWLNAGRGLGRDVRFGVRRLVRQPASGAALVLILALGIGAASATYAVFNAVVFRPVPGVHDPDRLISVYVQTGDPSRPGRTGGSHDRLVDMRTHAPALDGLAATEFGEHRLKLSADGIPVEVDGGELTAGGFEVLGVRARIGRLFAPEEYEASDGRVVVLSDRLWHARFDGVRSIVGRDVWIDDQRLTVVGVAADYQGPDLLGKEDLWLPFGARHLLDPGSGDDGFFHLVGRLAPGATVAQAEQQLRTVWAARGGLTLRGRTFQPTAFAGLTDGIGLTRARLLRIYDVLLLAVGTLFLLACASAANLLLARHLRRRRDLSVVAALGASRVRIVRELVAEAAIVALLASLAGLLTGWAFTHAFEGMRLLSYLPALQSIAIDWRVAAVTMAAAGATVVVFALAPAVLASRADPQEGLRETSRTTGRVPRLRAALVAVQLALALALVVGTALLGQTVARLRAEQPFDTRDVWTTASWIRPAGPWTRTTAVLRQIEDRLAAAPGAGVVALTNFDLTTSEGFLVRRPDQPASEASKIGGYRISARLLDAMGIPLLAGRSFTPAEVRTSVASAGGPIVLGESTARALFGSPADAVGRTLLASEGRLPDLQWRVIGVSADVAGSDLREGPLPTVFLPLDQTRAGSIVMRTALSGSDVAALVRRIAHDADPTLPPPDMVPLSHRLDESLASERLLTRLGTIMSAIAAALALAGVYAAVAFFVSERTRELGVRIALGASTGQVMGEVLRRILTTAGVGLAGGLLLVALLGHSLSSWLFEIHAWDPATLGAAVAGVLVSAIGAAWRPARRATRIDPAMTLRAE